MPIRRLTLMLFTAGLVATAPAHATLITAAYTITGSNFTNASGQPLPFSTVVENIALTFDNTTPVIDNTTGAVLLSGTIVPASTLGFMYIAGADTAIIGGVAATVTTADPASVDFALGISNASAGSPAVVLFSYSVGDGRVFSARTTSIVPYVADPPTTGAVPEPGSIVLLAAGLLAFGLVRRKTIEG